MTGCLALQFDLAAFLFEERTSHLDFSFLFFAAFQCWGWITEKMAKLYPISTEFHWAEFGWRSSEYIWPKNNSF